MKKSSISIVVLLIVNIIFFIYHSILDSKIQSFTDQFEEHTTAIIDNNTDIEDFNCLYNRPYFPELVDNFYSNNIQDYETIKNRYEDYATGRKKGHSINVGVSTIKCLRTSQRAFDFNIDHQIRNNFNILKRSIMIRSQGCYLHRQSIQIIDDGSKEFCNAALINTDFVDYSFEVEINGLIKKSPYSDSITIDNTSIKDGLISLSFLDPCEEGRRREFKLRI